MALQVWDIGGQTIGGQMLDTYIFGADVGVAYCSCMVTSCLL